MLTQTTAADGAIHIRISPGSQTTARAIKIVQHVAQHYGITYQQITSGSRARRHSDPRQVAMWVLVKYSGLTHVTIAQIFHRHHTTVVHSRQCIDNYTQTQPGYAKAHARLVAKVSRLWR